MSGVLSKMAAGVMYLYEFNGRVTDFMLNQNISEELAETIKILILIAAYARMPYDLEAALRIHFKLLSQHEHVSLQSSPPRVFREPAPEPSSDERVVNSPSVSESYPPF